MSQAEYACEELDGLLRPGVEGHNRDRFAFSIARVVANRVPQPISVCGDKRADDVREMASRGA
jgi:hypothetical protein